MKILVTGFDAFGEHTDNPSWLAVQQLPPHIAGASMITAQLPTAFQAASATLTALLTEHHPDVVLNVGQAGGRKTMTIERVAINCDDARIPDNHHAQPIDQPIVVNGPAAYFATVPIKAIVQAWQTAGLPAAVSNSAGTFVCNYVLYEALHWAHQHHPQMRAGFIHVPYIPEQVIDQPHSPSLPLDTIVYGLIIAIETIVARHHQSDISYIGGSEH